MLKVKFKGHPVLPCFNSSRHPNAMQWKAGEVREFDKENAELLMGDFPGLFVLEVVTSAASKPAVDRSVKAPAKKAPRKRASPKKPAKKKSKDDA